MSGVVLKVDSHTKLDNRIPSPRHIVKKKLFVFDWDDTLMPTSFFQLARYRLSFKKSFLQPIYQQQLTLLEKKIIKLFEVIINFPNSYLYIVTNAIDQWVEQSCSHFMPQLFEYLLDIKQSYNKLNKECPYSIISAQGKYGLKCPKNRFTWKYCTFSDICDSLMLIDKQYDNTIINSNKYLKSYSNFYDSPRSVSKSVSVTLTEQSKSNSSDINDYCDVPLFIPQSKFIFPQDDINMDKLPLIDDFSTDDIESIYVWDLISIGDGEYEANASRKVANTINKNNQFYCNVTPKIIKFRCQPTLVDMIKQLEHLTQSIECISNNPVDKELYISNIEKYNQTQIKEEI